ncbi:hypothetical protein EC845_1224 [Comamonas sp. BIGb0124]|uniref:hypothetical protein n=1 Tax=Comamonas sp. BIGb0124 TaxID=2485130 RepID=UPI000F4AC399|nr:hypothetical protein [Comamonas sp. BIGb0124]ROR25184.1 hypothetical protein EC845_1224 [Comamonas sp. BIGb0124]
MKHFDYNIHIDVVAEHDTERNDWRNTQRTWPRADLAAVAFVSVAGLIATGASTYWLLSRLLALWPLG